MARLTAELRLVDAMYVTIATWRLPAAWLPKPGDCVVAGRPLKNYLVAGIVYEPLTIYLDPITTETIKNFYRAARTSKNEDSRRGPW